VRELRRDLVYRQDHRQLCPQHRVKEHQECPHCLH
jgi:hypothetical protein